MSNGSKLLLVGLRGSGKTSYLAALWHLIEAGEVPTALVASRLQPDREYLNKIRDSWLRFEDFGRTSLRGQEVVSLELRDTATGANINVVVPDLSGELFRLQWATRRATRQYAQFAAECVGVLLFVHPLDIKNAPRISPPDGESTTSAGPPSSSVPSTTSAEAKDVLTSLTEWSSDYSPTQVQLVELLQFITYLKPQASPLRVAVIVSAWDLVKDQIPPTSWLETHLPLLFQFVVANVQQVPFRVFGVSAIGGDLKKDLERLQEEAVPSQRIRVVGNGSSPHSDLTVPVRFLIESDGICDKPMET